MPKEIKVFYTGALNSDLDDVLKTLAKQHGYKFWASGYNFEENIRDLAFERRSNR